MFGKWHFMGQRSMHQGIRAWVHQGSQALPPLCLPRMGAQLPTALLRCSDHTCPSGGVPGTGIQVGHTHPVCQVTRQDPWQQWDIAFTPQISPWSREKVKVTQSCPALCNPKDCTVHGILQATILEWVAVPFSRGIFPMQGSNPGLPHCRRILYQLSHKGSLRILEWVAYPFSSGSSPPRNWTGVSWIAGRFFTNWAMRQAHEPENMTLNSELRTAWLMKKSQVKKEKAFFFFFCF